jgi:hypothetical protein
MDKQQLRLWPTKIIIKKGAKGGHFCLASDYSLFFHWDDCSLEQFVGRLGRSPEDVLFLGQMHQNQEFGYVDFEFFDREDRWKMPLNAGHEFLGHMLQFDLLQILDSFILKQ